MQASFFRYILNWTLYRISRKIKWNESQIFITGKLFLIRHPCHVLPCRVPYMSRPSLSCSLHVTSFLVLFLTCHVPSLPCSLHVTFLLSYLFLSSSFLISFPSNVLSFLICPCHAQFFTAVLVTFLLFSAVLVSCILLSSFCHTTFFLAILVILLPSQLFQSYYFLLNCFCHITSIWAVPIRLLPSQLFISCYFLLNCPCHVNSFSAVLVMSLPSQLSLSCYYLPSCPCHITFLSHLFPI